MENQKINTQEQEWVVTGIEKIDDCRFYPVINEGVMCKPVGGLWAGPLLADGEFLSEWQQWTYEEFQAKYSSDGIAFKLKPGTKIYTIDCFEDLEELLKHYSLSDEYMGSFAPIDFEKMSKDYDGIYLTRAGETRTRFSRPSLYGWDVECLLLMNFEAIGEQRKVSRNT